MKNKFFKKALSVFTAMAMVFSLMTGIPFSELGLGITASAAEILANGTCGAEGNENSVTWSLDSDGTLTISGSGAMADYEMVENYPYHYTTPWHDTDNDDKYQNSNIKKVVVKEGITHIGNAAFRDFIELTSISIPNTVKSIGYRSVSYCWNLESLVIPDSVTSIGKEAFDNNLMLTSVTIGNSVESIGAFAFSYMGLNAESNFTITLPKSVTYIDSSAFSNIYSGATIRYSCSYNDGKGYSTKYTNATLEQYHLCEYSSSGNKINCSGCTCGEYSSSTATLSLSSDEPIYYTGEEIKPAVTVTYPDGWGGDKIEPNESNCTYLGNINAGTATCTFKYAEGVEASIDFTIAECPHWGVDSDGMCDNCDYLDEPERVDEYYQIANAGNLMWFAKQVNEGRTTINAELTADIVVNSGTFSTDNAGNPLYNGEAISETNKPVEWTPIGSYTGTFNGQNHTISGLYFNNTSQSYVGLFGQIGEGASIENVGVINSSFNGSGNVGGICGENSGTITNCYSSGTVSGASSFVGGVCGYNSGTITNCYSSGTVSGKYYVGGVCGSNSGTIENCYSSGTVSGKNFVGSVCGYNDGTITNCYSSGTVSGSNYVGGVCGNNSGTIENCYSSGTVSGSDYVGGICAYNDEGTIRNCYYDNTVYNGDAIALNGGTTTNVLGKTTDEFASGEVAYLLNGSSSENVTWYQKLLTDTYPVLDSEHGIVYSVFKCDGTTPAGYSNENENEPHIDENGDEYCDDCDVIYNGIGAHLAGYSVSLNGSIGVNFHMDLTQDVLDDNEAYMLFTLPNGTAQKVMVSDAKAKGPAVIEEKKYYIFTCNVAAKEMTDTIQAQLITSDGSKTQVYEYSVREYADTILSNMYDSYDYKTIELVKAMLHYGAYSQEWFNYNTTNLANAELENLGLSEADNWDEFNPIITNNDKVGSFTSAYLTLESDTAINLKFKLADGVSFEDLRVEVHDTIGNVVPATTVTTGNVCLITLTGIKASDLDTMYDFSVTDKEDNESTITYSAMSYARAVADSEMDQKLKDLTAALRIFNLKADDKFEC